MCAERKPSSKVQKHITFGLCLPVCCILPSGDFSHVWEVRGSEARSKWEVNILLKDTSEGRTGFLVWRTGFHVHDHTYTSVLTLNLIQWNSRLDDTKKLTVINSLQSKYTKRLKNKSFMQEISKWSHDLQPLIHVKRNFVQCSWEFSALHHMHRHKTQAKE